MSKKPDLDGFNKELKEVIEVIKAKHGFKDHKVTTLRVNMVEKKLLKENNG